MIQEGSSQDADNDLIRSSCLVIGGRYWSSSYSPVHSQYLMWGNLALLKPFLGSKVMGLSVGLISAYTQLFPWSLFFIHWLYPQAQLWLEPGVCMSLLPLIFAFSALRCLQCDMLNADGICEKGNSTCEAKDDQECGILVVSEGGLSLGDHRMILLATNKVGLATFLGTKQKLYVGLCFCVNSGLGFFALGTGCLLFLARWRNFFWGVGWWCLHGLEKLSGNVFRDKRIWTVKFYLAILGIGGFPVGQITGWLEVTTVTPLWLA